MNGADVTTPHQNPSRPPPLTRVVTTSAATHPHPRASSPSSSHLHRAAAALSERGHRISHRWIWPQGSEGHESPPPSSPLPSPPHHRLPRSRPLLIALHSI
ncbi:hypothetical protein DAI22_03g290000 [Oryza sativa Japonica Group]|nr:hypothetical protein DAI22_03g290000 [Oryza sativa Japonica Group]